MASLPLRDQVTDHLLTPQNSALLIIDYQPTLINSVNSMKRSELISNILLVIKIAKLYKLPIILSTINVRSGANNDTIPALRAELFGIKSYDRTSIDAWEDKEFYDAVKAAGRKKLLITALWTEACLTFPTLDALKEGYEVYPIVDAVGGSSETAHKTALRRVEQAGAKLTTIPQVTCELQRDWNRQETAMGVIGILRDAGIFLKLD